MRKRFVSGSMAVFVGLFVALAVQAADKEVYKVGDSISAFTLADVNGKEHDLGEQLGNKIIVLEFVNKDCPVSQAYVERMKALKEQFAKEDSADVVFYGIDSNEPNSAEDIAAFAKEKGIKATILKDKGNQIADRFGAERTPEVYVIGKDKVLHYHGSVDDSQNESKIKHHYLSDALTAMKEGKEVPKKETAAFGCNIKRAEKS